MYESWLQMDHFYYEVFPKLLAVICFFGVIFISGMMNMENKIVKRMGQVSLTIVVITSIYAAVGFYKHGHLIHLSQSATPAVREYRRQFMRNEYVPFWERFAYKNGYTPSHYEQVELYDTEELEESVKYLGRDDKYYYFELDGQPFFATERAVEFTDKVDEAIRTGRRFHLKDSRFMSLGFYEESRIFQDLLLVPTSMKSRTLTREDTENIEYLPDILDGWVVR